MTAKNSTIPTKLEEYNDGINYWVSGNPQNETCPFFSIRPGVLFFEKSYNRGMFRTPRVPSSLEVACGKRELALVAVDSSPQSVVPHRRRRRSSGSPPSRSSSPAEDVEMEEELLANLREVEELRLAIAQRISSAPPGVPPEAGFFQLDAPVEDQSFDLSTLQNDSSELSGPPGTPPPLPQPIPGWMSRPSPSVPSGAELAVSRPRAHPVPFPSLPAGDVSGLPRFPHFGSLLGSIHRLVDGPPGPPPVDDQTSSSGPAPSGVAPGLSPVRPEVILDSLQVASPGAVVPLAPEVLQLQQQVSALEQFLTGNMAVSPEALATQITHSVELQVRHAHESLLQLLNSQIAPQVHTHVEHIISDIVTRHVNPRFSG